MCFIAAVPVKWETGQSLGDPFKANAKDLEKDCFCAEDPLYSSSDLHFEGNGL